MMGNLADVYKKLTHRDKLEIIVAWELMHGQRHSVGVVPFLDKDKVEQALLRRMSEGPNYQGVGGVLVKLGTKVVDITQFHKTEDVFLANGTKQLVIVATTVTVKVERHDKEGNIKTEELVFML